ncbi:DUF975 family protein [Alkalibacterium pelagium]|uniref:Uncharacterized membrane protein n=1 Tax=Alkalibacterium pelagium TaxID=426702 RepID=A0A1H7EWM5_9LACT|nr:DUF975 family protein [Alkalibacterium pelagium]GEN49666.1 membrane protein [Alkalibacterium pelagium]SEK17517.1 Uncharacterized membrane protein [Alkalibacterium pelagium]
MNAETYLSPASIKRQAREELSGKWRDVILLYLVPFVISLLLTGGIYGFDLTSIPRIIVGEEEGNILINFLVTYLTIGISFTLLDMIRSSSYKIKPLPDAFQVFSRRFFIPVFLIQLLQTLFIVLWTLVFIIPGIIKTYSYSQAFFIFKDKKDLGTEEYPAAFDCITESRYLMDGHKLELFFLHLSFIGWYLLEVFTLGIASLYVRPYLNMAEAVFYSRLRYDHKETDDAQVDGYYHEAGFESKVHEEEKEDEEDEEYDDFAEY